MFFARNDNKDIGHFIEMDYQTNKPLSKLKTNEFYEKYRTPDKVSIYSQTLISTCVEMINGKDARTNPLDLIKKLFGDENNKKSESSFCTLV